MYDIFISCKSDDYTKAENVYHWLVEKGYCPFFAPISLRTSTIQGEPVVFGDEIDDALEQADNMIVFTSNAEYVKKGYVKDEWRTFVEEQRAGRKTGSLVTILDGVNVADLPIRLRSVQSFTLSNYQTGILRFLRNTLIAEIGINNDIVGKKEEQESQAMEEAERLRLEQEQKDREEAEHKAKESEKRRRLECERKADETRHKFEKEHIKAEFKERPRCPLGAINGVFSISPTEKVCFSKGNLRYQTGTQIWRFAVNQYDCIGQGNANISKASSNWIDLFGWGTGDNPTKSSRWTGRYPGFLDWGMNQISNGDNIATSWRTLTKNEWEYVIEARHTASGIRFVKGQVNNVNGVILLPDDWKEKHYKLNNLNQRDKSFNGNVIDSYTWDSVLQAYGAVFLPAAGIREGVSVCYEGSRGYYWSASTKNNNSAYGLYFNDGDFYPANYGSLNSGYSVRLVCPAE